MIWKVIGNKLMLVSATNDEHSQTDIHFTKFVNNYRFHPLVKKKLWDGKIKFYKNGCVPIGLWKEVADLNQYGFEVEIEGIRECFPQKYTLEDVKVSFAEITRSIPNFQSRKYQEEAIVLLSKFKFCMAELATSAGKTLVIYGLYHLLKSKKDINRMLMIVPSLSLIDQARRDFISYSLSLEEPPKIGIIGDGLEIYDADTDILIGTYQSLVKKDAEFFNNFEMVVTDEAHQAKAKSLTDILGKCSTAKYRIGVSGTIPKSGADWFTLQSNLGPIVKKVTAKELIQNEWAAKVKILIVKIRYTSEEVVEKYKNLYYLNRQEKNKILQIEKKILCAFKPRTEIISKYVGKVKGNVLVLFNSVADGFGESLVKQFQKDYPVKKIRYIDGSVKDSQRQEIFSTLESENDCILVATFGTVATGINIKNLKAVVFTESYKSSSIIRQSIGRGMRLHKNKSHVIIIDIADDLRFRDEISEKIITSFTTKHLKERIKTYVNEKHEVSKVEHVI